jgi:hypothetical protein
VVVVVVVLLILIFEQKAFEQYPNSNASSSDEWSASLEKWPCESHGYYEF